MFAFPILLLGPARTWMRIVHKADSREEFENPAACPLSETASMLAAPHLSHEGPGTRQGAMGFIVSPALLAVGQLRHEELASHVAAVALDISRGMGYTESA